MRIRHVPFLCLAAGMLAVPAAHAEDVWVQVRKTNLRSAPEFYAPSVADLSYGTKVTKVGDQDGWVQVKAGGKSGYLPLASVTEAQIILEARNIKNVNAEVSDVVLAGKGFSKEVEAAYKQQDAAARFDLVDKLERNSNVSQGELVSFVKGGKLKG